MEELREIIQESPGRLRCACLLAAWAGARWADAWASLLAGAAGDTAEASLLWCFGLLDGAASSLVARATAFRAGAGRSAFRADVFHDLIIDSEALS